MAAPSVGKNAKQRSASITSMAPFDTRLRSAVIAADVGLVERLLGDPEARKILRQPRIVFSTTVQSSTLEKASKNPDLLNLFLKVNERL